MNLSAHFSLEELTASDLAARLSIPNVPNDIELKNLSRLAQSLEAVRALLGGSPIHINSGFRSVALNFKVGGQKASAHLSGLAADFICPSFGTPLEICRALEISTIPFDQVILEYYDSALGSGWCHFAVSSSGLIGRRECLTINKNGTKFGLPND